MKRPMYLETKRHAREWLAWACQNWHSGSCACRGCLRSRQLLAGREVTVPEPE